MRIPCKVCSKEFEAVFYGYPADADTCYDCQVELERTKIRATKKCECGADKAQYQWHSDYCPKSKHYGSRK
jgi:hypothetical protein